MSNVFRVGEDGFSRSNGGSQVLLNTLTLAASTLARSPWERACAAWLNGCALSSRFGTGGFDLLGIPWSPVPEEHARQRAFLHQVTALAMTGHRWNTLPYSPASDLARASLTAFQTLLDHPRLTSGVIQPQYLEFETGGEVSFCEKHGVYFEEMEEGMGCDLCLEG